MYVFFKKHVHVFLCLLPIYNPLHIGFSLILYDMKPRKENLSGALFCNCFRSSQRSGRKNFIFFSTNRMPPLPLHRILRNVFCVASSNYLIIKLFLFYNCLHSFFAFYANDYDTGRYVDCFVVGSNHCVDNILA